MPDENYFLKKKNLILPDTNVLIGDIEALDNFIKDGNLVVIAFTVFQELDDLKNKPRVSRQAAYVSEKIEELVFSNSGNLVIERNTNFSNLNLDPKIRDHQIIATFNYLLTSGNINYSAFNKYKFVSNDRNMRVNAYDLFKDKENVQVEAYLDNQIKPHRIEQEIPIVSKNIEDISLVYDEKVFGPIVENGGIILQDQYGVEENSVLLMRKGLRMNIIPKDLVLCGVRPKFKGRINWGQLLAMAQLLDNNISAIFLEGPAGTGKTLLALAAALTHKESFDQMILVNPMVPLGNKDRMGFLPGDQKDKISPWMLPFEQNLKFLEKNYSHFIKHLKIDTKLTRLMGGNITQNVDLSIWERYGFVAQSLDYIRGQTIANAFIIVEEAQNLTQLEIKTIITRIGLGSRVVFCGDLSQVDDKIFLSLKTSGLLYAIERLVDYNKEGSLVAASLLSLGVRSRLSQYASSRL